MASELKHIKFTYLYKKKMQKQNLFLKKNKFNKKL